MKHRLLTLAAFGATAMLAGTAHASDGSPTTGTSQPKPDAHYQVVSGDSLSTIAEQYQLDSWRPIWNANTNLSDPDLIHAGDDLVIPAGDTTDRPIPVDAVQPVSINNATYKVTRSSARPAANYAAGSAGLFERIRLRESGGNYATNTGNGYYGAYQYNLGTWNNYGGYARPDLAPPSVQDAKAAETFAARGCSPWPNTCY